MTYEQKMQDCERRASARKRERSIIRTINIFLRYNFDKETIIKDMMDEFPVSRIEVSKISYHFEKDVLQHPFLL